MEKLQVTVLVISKRAVRRVASKDHSQKAPLLTFLRQCKGLLGFTNDQDAGNFRRNQGQASCGINYSSQKWAGPLRGVSPEMGRCTSPSRAFKSGAPSLKETSDEFSHSSSEQLLGSRLEKCLMTSHGVMGPHWIVSIPRLTLQ